MVTQTAKSFLIGCTLLAVVAEMVLPILPSYATRYRPPSNMQRPAGRQGAATRNDCVQNQFVFAPLVPRTNAGQTLAKRPTLYWYANHHSFTWARFELYAAPNLQPTLTPLYRKTFKLQGNEPLHRIALPRDTVPALTVGQDYLWQVTLICSSGGPDDDTADGSQRMIRGWIRRVPPTAELQTQISGFQRKYDGYAESGLWYDAIDNLAKRLRKHPQNAQFLSDWQDLVRETSLDPNLFAVPSPNRQP
ncbi:MAG TPA: DUF928 domain-containing protein [Stenomitos sp.]